MAKHADLVASGRARQFMTIVGAFVNDWRFQVDNAQHGDLEVKILAPSEEWPDRHELAVAVTDAVQSQT